LVFVGGKILATDLIGTLPAWASLSITVGLLAAGVLYSLYRTRTAGEKQVRPRQPTARAAL